MLHKIRWGFLTMQGSSLHSIVDQFDHQPAAGGGGDEFLLLETGDFLLLETGDKVILE